MKRPRRGHGGFYGGVARAPRRAGLHRHSVPSAGAGGATRAGRTAGEKRGAHRPEEGGRAVAREIGRPAQSAHPGQDAPHLQGCGARPDVAR